MATPLAKPKPRWNRHEPAPPVGLDGAWWRRAPRRWQCLSPTAVRRIHNISDPHSPLSTIARGVLYVKMAGRRTVFIVLWPRGDRCGVMCTHRQAPTPGRVVPPGISDQVGSKLLLGRLCSAVPGFAQVRDRRVGRARAGLQESRTVARGGSTRFRRASPDLRKDLPPRLRT
jgi:hypothetical protein